MDPLDETNIEEMRGRSESAGAGADSSNGEEELVKKGGPAKVGGVQSDYAGGMMGNHLLKLSNENKSSN